MQDVLLHNSDRHPGHFMHGPHWARPGAAPFLIDHAAGFREEARVSMADDDAFSSGGIDRVRAATYLRLKLLGDADIRGAVGPHLGESEVLELLERRDGVLAFFDRLVAERGADAVLLAEDGA